MYPALTVFIDEAGDPGIKDGLRYATTRHEWLCMAAVVIRSSSESEIVDWVAQMRKAAHSTQSGALHYNRIARGRRTEVCGVLAQQRARGFVVASHKSNLREYVNPRVQKMIDGGTFFNWCLRLLLERVTAWAERLHQEEEKELSPLRIVFAQRGHDWDHFFSYVDLLKMQAQNKALFLKGPGLSPELLDRSTWSVAKADSLAGLQLADTVASAFYSAANANSPNFDIAPASALKPIITSWRQSHANVGVTVWPLPHQAAIPEESRPIFKVYDYGF